MEVSSGAPRRAGRSVVVAFLVVIISLVPLSRQGYAVIPTRGVASTLMIVDEDGVRVTSVRSAERAACSVSIRATALITPAMLFDQVRVTFDQDCRPNVERESKKRAATLGSGRLAAPLAMHGYRVNCRSLNQFWGSGGSGGGNLRTQYRSWLEFEVAEGMVWSLYSAWRDAYLSPWTLYRWTNDYIYADQTSVPAMSIRTYRVGTFYNGPSWDHDKHNDSYGYSNGQCYTEFYHQGYVWDGVVEFRLEYY